MSVRRPSNRDGKRYIGKFPSFRLNRTIWFESLLERDFLYLLEYDHLDVEYFESQPCRIHYRREGRKRRYTPDFLVVRKGGRQIVEVKPEEKALEERNREIFRIAAAACARQGYEFRVVTDAEIRIEPRLENVKILLRYQRTEVLPQHQILSDEFFAGRREATLGEFMDFFASKGFGKQIVYSLIRWGVVRINLDETIRLGSRVFLPGEDRPKGEESNGGL
jgi:hypothetical protein